ncbi:hypothetical protein Tco_1203751 [Tanacetum coccineum]
MPSVSLPSKVFTFMRKHSTKFSCKITPLTPSMLEVVSALAAEEEQSTSPHSRAAVLQGNVSKATPTSNALMKSKSAAYSQNASIVKSGETEELDLETTQSTARQGTITPRTLNFEDEAGPSSPLHPIQILKKNAQDKESLEKGISMITALQVIDSLYGEYLNISIQSYRANNPLSRLMLLDDLNIIWETLNQVIDDFLEGSRRMGNHKMERVDDKDARSWHGILPTRFRIVTVHQFSIKEFDPNTEEEFEEDPQEEPEEEFEEDPERLEAEGASPPP